MVHTLPDYTAQYKTLMGIQSADVYEAAARLGSVDRITRTGKVYWMDDFRDGINGWSETFSDGGTGGGGEL